MANHKSAAKRARQSIRKNARNSQALNSVRTFEKKLITALAAGDSATAKVALVEYTSKASKAVQKGVVHLKTASRKIGRLSERVDKLLAR